MHWLDTALALCAVTAALLLRPWRALGRDGPPWPWLAWWALLPAFWAADRFVAMPVAQPLSGACLLMLMAGWPLAVLALLPVAGLAALIGHLGGWEMLHRLVWLGLVPATLALAFGAALRRWLPHHLFVYILGRAFFATAAAGALAGAAAALQHTRPGLAFDDMALGAWLTAWGDAWICGMLVAIFVAFRPEWLATYADRLSLPAAPPRAPPRTPPQAPR